MMNYKEAVELIALNDNPTEMTVRNVQESSVVLMVSDIYEVSAFDLANAIVDYRRREQKSKPKSNRR